jgi:hypothetical protein
MATLNATPKITVTATINAPKHTVWECYTEPEHIIHWNFAGDDWCCRRATNDMVIGGRYVARMDRSVSLGPKLLELLRGVLRVATDSLFVRGSKGKSTVRRT